MLRAAISCVLLLWFGGAACAAVPFCRTLPAPKVLCCADASIQQELAERLRAATGADVTVLPLYYVPRSATGTADDFDQETWHFADKPLEMGEADRDYIRKEGRAFVESMTRDLRRFDVVLFLSSMPRAGDGAKQLRELEERIVAYVREGGKLVFVSRWGESLLREVLPVKAGNRSDWVVECQGATDHPLARGIPLEVTGSHHYGQVGEPADESSLPLTRNPERDRFWVRKFPGGGESVYLYEVYGGRWQWSDGGVSWDKYAAERPDDVAVWDAFFQRVLYGLTYGDRAFPVLAKIALPEKAAVPSGRRLDVPVDVENRSGEERSVQIVLTVSHRRSDRKITASQPASLRPGERKTITLTLDVELPCSDPYVLLQAQVLDQTGEHVLSESTAWAPYIHQVPVTVRTARPNYGPGEAIEIMVDHETGALPAETAPRLYLVDHEGRSMQSGDVKTRFVMPDGGPKLLSSYWVVAVVSDGEKILGTARYQVQLDRPWTMREQLQWSVWTEHWSRNARGVALLRDAGINALGMIGNAATADRHGLRQYVESTGINTFGVTIDHDNWNAVRAEMEKTLAAVDAERGADSRSKVLVSLGEESGFKNGWGQRYYWDGPQAPPVVQKVFSDYLSERYDGRLETLNREWATDYRSFAEVPLEKRKVRAPAKVFVAAQAWEAARKEGKANDTYPVDTKAIDPGKEYLAHTAPYYETNRFFDWYYQKYCDLAAQVYRQRRNPVPLTIMSAPGGFYPKVDVYNFNGLGPSYPKETALVGNALARRDYGDVPGFSAAQWTHFDLHSLWSCTVLSYLLAGNTHIDHWAGAPLTFNADLTHTRASFWAKVLARQTRPIEPVLLHRRFAATKKLGMFIPEQPVPKGILERHFASAIDANAPLYSALEESGYLPAVVQLHDLTDVEVLFASHAQVVSADEGKQLADFVERGGLLVATPWLASCSPHGNLLSVYPAKETGLADLLGFKLLNTSQQPAPEEVKFSAKASFGIAQPLTVLSQGRDKVLDRASDVEVLAEYQDGTPLLLSRRVGRGRVVYLNFMYDWGGWWNSFSERPREAYRKLIEGILRTDGRVNAEYFLGFESAEAVQDSKGWFGMVWDIAVTPARGESVPWWASQLFADPSGTARYLAVWSDHRSPKITAQLHWASPDVKIFDLFQGKEVPSAQGKAALTLRPGEAAFWAIVPADALVADAFKLEVPDRLEAGEAVKVLLELPDRSPLVHGIVVDVYSPSGELSRSHSLANVNVAGGHAEVAIPTAANDVAGDYRLVATESTTRARAEKMFTLTAGRAVLAPISLAPFPPRASDDWPEHRLSSQQFLDELRRLRSVYEGTYAGLEAKWMLSFYLNVSIRPNNRHAIMRRLQRTDWMPHLETVAEALRAGETFYLLGEDFNVDPETKMAIDPFAVADPGRFVEALVMLQGARRETLTVDNLTFEVIRLGNGALLTSTASVDRQAFHSSDFIAWHQELKTALLKARGR